MSQHSIVQLQTSLSVVKAATGTLKMRFSIICVGLCSSIRHTDWCKPHLRMPSLRITYGPRSLPRSPTPPGEAGCCCHWLFSHLTWGLSASHSRWFWESQPSLPGTHPILCHRHVSWDTPEGTPNPAPFQAAWAQGKDDQSLPNPLLPGRVHKKQLYSQTIFKLRLH